MHRAVRRVREQADPIGLRAVGRPHLAAIDDVVVAVLARGRLDGGDVRSRTDFRHTEAGDIIAGDRGREKFAAHVVIPEARERRRRHIRLDADRHGNTAAVDGAKLLRHRDRVGVVEPLAAECDRFVQPEETEIPHLLEERVRREDLRLLPLIDVRIDLGGDELLQAAPQLLVLVGELHGYSS